MSILVDSPARVTDERQSSSSVTETAIAPACATTLHNVAAARRGSNVRGVVRARGGAELCDHGGRWTATAARAPAAVTAYLDSLGDDRFDLRAACAHWAGTFSQRHQSAADSPQSAQAAARAPDRVSGRRRRSARSSSTGSSKPGTSRSSNDARNFVVVDLFEVHVDASGCIAIINSPRSRIRRARLRRPGLPDHFDGTPAPAVAADLHCWQRAARATFPNDPCIDELWGHEKIGWDSDVAARSLPRIVAVLDSGIDAAPRGPRQQRGAAPGYRRSTAHRRAAG